MKKKQTKKNNLEMLSSLVAAINSSPVPKTSRDGILGNILNASIPKTARTSTNIVTLNCEVIKTSETFVSDVF